MIFKNDLKSEYATPQMGFMDIKRSKTNLTPLLTQPPLTQPPLPRQYFRFPCDVELAGEDVYILYSLFLYASICCYVCYAQDTLQY